MDDRTARYQALDIVRIVAALAVVIHHARNPMALQLGPLDPDLGLAVFVFFSLSGFLVFTPFVRGPVAPGAHVTRRMLRIFPAYLVVLVVTLVLTDPSSYPAGHELEFALMLHPLDASQAVRAMAVAWTLHVEVVFYLALPILAVVLVAVCGTEHLRRALFVSALGAISLAGFLVTDPTQLTSSTRVLLAPLMFWAFVPGMLVAWALARSPSLTRALSRRRVLLIGSLLTLVPILFPVGGANQPLDMVAVCVGAALMIPGLLELRLRWRVAGIMAGAGRTLSYPVYLWHITLLMMVAEMGVTGWTGFAAALLLLLLFSSGSWLLVERPALALSARLLSCHAWIRPWRTSRTAPMLDSEVGPAAVHS